jgi:membrane associated rhomboid family serine protease
MSYQEKEYKQRLSLGQKHNSLIMLIVINLVVFAILAFILTIYQLRSEDKSVATRIFNQNILSWFGMSSDPGTAIRRPWTFITQMITHTDIWKILGNMLWLWVFGYILQDLTGNRKIFPVYIYGALTGAIAFIIAYNYLPVLQGGTTIEFFYGAAPGIMAIAAAITTLAPGYRVFPMLNGGIPIWIVTALYLIIDMATVTSNGPSERISHLGGALAGFLFIFSYRRGYDWGEWMNNLYDWFTNLFNPEKPKKGKNIKQQLFYKSTAKPYHKTPNVTAQRVDEILDKISEHGYDSLTEEEKELLKKASKDS